MTSDEIIELAHIVKEMYGNDPIKICNKLKIPINYINLRPDVTKAYTIKVFEKTAININNQCTLKSQKVLCAHELGHVLIHSQKSINEFNDNDLSCEYEANLFAVSLLFNQDDLNYSIRSMDNYMLKELLNCNIKLIS